MTHLNIPEHVAIIMDGNGRWAKQRHLPRIAGHKVGVDTVRTIVKECVKKKVGVLSLFAFSSENWRRPQKEVKFLFDLFTIMLHREIKEMHRENIQISVIGDLTPFSEKFRKQIVQAEKLTASNTGLKLILAINYGGQWDLAEACKKLGEEIEQGKISSQAISAELIKQKLSLAHLPDPDLFIRTSGEQRISNFFLWQLSYSELYFTEVLWPDFNAKEFEKALEFFASRERRFGYTGEQIKAAEYA